MKYTNAWFIQQGVTPIDAFTNIRLYCCKYQLYDHISTHICGMQEKISWYDNCKMQCRIFQRPAQFVHSKYQKTNLVHLYINLGETFALILNLKILFKFVLWLKLLILKNTLHALNLYSHILKIMPTPFSCMFKYELPFYHRSLRG